MERTLDGVTKKNEYLAPIVDVYRLDCKDILCMSTEGKDNDFDASGLGNF